MIMMSECVVSLAPQFDEWCVGRVSYECVGVLLVTFVAGCCCALCCVVYLSVLMINSMCDA